MKKILIYMPKNKLKPTGGPAGYLYNLNKGLEKINSNIEFLEDIKPSKPYKVKIKKIIPSRILTLLKTIKLTKLIYQKETIDDKYLNYDIIHFHSTTDLYKNRDFLEKYTGKVVLTSHSPCAMHVELKNSITKNDYARFKKRIDELEKIDIYAFKRCDYVIFPCESAEEPYLNSWPKYKEIRKNLKIKYLYTGIEECKPRITKEMFREQNNYTKDDFLLCYIGRHNEIKGYDNFLKIGKKAIDKFNAKIIVAGKEEPIKGLKNNNWKEIGWTDDPYSIINASDIFILPNKETYFDLIMLEVLSLGKIVLTTRTGGNREFEKFKNIGVFYYDNIDECINKIEYIKNLSEEQKKKYESNNKKIFKDNFSNNQFAKKYIELMNEL